MVLDAYERGLKGWLGPNPRLRIEHCSLVNPDLIARIKKLGVIPAPFYTYAYYHGEKWSEYGEDKMEHMFAHRSFIDAGIPVAPASDFTPGPYEPMMALQSMVTRKDTRPLLRNTDSRATLERLLKQREPLYAQADITVESDAGPHEMVVKRILAALDARDRQPSMETQP